MNDQQPISIEEKVHLVTLMPEPRTEFVNELWNQLSQQPSLKPSLMDRFRSVLHPSLVVAAAILLVLAILFVGFGPKRVYATVRQLFGLGDPGLQSVQDEGLVTKLNMTALPTVVMTQTPANTPPLVSTLTQSQNLDGITLTLDWAYLDEGRLAMGMEFTPLPEDITLGSPQLTFIGVTPVQSFGYSQSLRSDENRAVYVSYQVIDADSVDGKASFGVDVPLIQQNGNFQTTLANFHFDVRDVSIYTGQTLSIQQTYAVQRNGVEIRLKSVRVMPSNTEVVACYDFPTQDAPFWYMQHATVQIGDGPEESYRPYQYLTEIKDDHCVKLGFATGNAGGQTRLVFRVHQLIVPLTMQDVLPIERINAANQKLAQSGIEIKPAPADQSEGPGGWQFVREPVWGTDPTQDPRLLVLQALEEKMDGPWEFYVDIPTTNLIPDQAKPTPTVIVPVSGE